MRYITPIAAAFIATLVLTGPTPPVAHAQDAEPTPAVVQKLKLRLRGKADRCALRVALPIDAVFDTLDVRTDVVAIDIGGQRIFELPAPDARTRLKERKPLLWKFRDGRRGPRLAVDIAFRTVKLNVPRTDLDVVAATALDAGVRVTVTLGDRVFEQVVDMLGNARKLVLAPPAPVVGSPSDGPGDGDGGGGGSGTVDVAARTLATAGMSGIETPRNVVIRNVGDWTALWNEHQRWVSPAAPVPPVDFSREMVVAVLFGNRSSPAHSIELRKVVSDGATTTVRTTDARITSGNCAFPAVVVQPGIFLAVPRTDAVTFDTRIEQRSCP